MSKSKASQHLLSVLNDFKSVDDKSLLVDALDTTKYLSMIQMMRVVRLIYHKALESSGNAYPMTWLSFMVIEKDDSELFLESLMTCCREWLSQQGAELKRKNKYHDGWSAFVAFLRELYACLQPKKMKSDNVDLSCTDLVQRQAQKHSQCLANLILDSGLTLLDVNRTKDPAYAVHVESVVNTLRCVGVYLQQDNSFKLDQLMTIFRTVLLSESAKISSMSRKNLMEAIECKASNWIFTPNQQVSSM